MKKNKNVKLKNQLPKRFFSLFFIICFIFASLLAKIFWIQFVDGANLKELATKQQTTTKTITARRGTIYDSTGKPLALSANVDTITINPKNFIIENSESETKKLQELVASGLSKIFELNYNDVLEKVCSTNSVETIIKKVEENKIEELKTWIKENKINSGINIDTDTKRYYPNSSLAANLIGCCGDDNQGLAGLEYYWNSTLTGISGKITSSKNVSGQLISDENEKYIAAENGCNITLTLDINIQTIAEKYLEQAVTNNNCDNGNLIIMDPTTGDILAMASNPSFDLNNPFIPNSKLKDTWDTLSTTAKSEAIQKMWRNTAVSNTYEPGSTFKTIMASIALEEDIVTTDKTNDFYCSSVEHVAEYAIRCTNTSGHGYQSLREALQHSCNPAFVQLGQKIGKATLYDYLEAFGLFEKTGIQTAGEVTGIFHKEEDVGPVELATISFGQRFTITPLQLITAVSAIANNGTLMQPKIVKSIENTDTGVITTIESQKVRQVISEETSAQVCNMMESVVVSGGGQYGQVSGYSIGGKTGTSEPPVGNKAAGYVSSFIAIAPVENTKVVVLLVLYNPKGTTYFGGQIAAPVVSQVLSEILPYLEIPSNTTPATTTTNSSTVTTKTLPDVQGKTVEEAKTILTEAGFTSSYTCDPSETVSQQVPKPGVSLVSGSIIKLYSANDTARTSVSVPNLKGLTYLQTKNTLLSKNLNIKVIGSGKVISQDPIAETSVEEGSIITVTFKDEIDSSSH